MRHPLSSPGSKMHLRNILLWRKKIKIPVSIISHLYNESQSLRARYCEYLWNNWWISILHNSFLENIQSCTNIGEFQWQCIICCIYTPMLLTILDVYRFMLKVNNQEDSLQFKMVFITRIRDVNNFRYVHGWWTMSMLCL